VEQKLIEFEAELAPGTQKDLYIGTAFIVFEKPRDVFTVLTEFEESVMGKAWRIFRTIFCGCCCKPNDIYKYKFERAPEPTDVYWENLHIKTIQRIKNVLVTYTATLLVIGVCFLVTYGLNELKDSMQETEDGEEEGSYVKYGMIRLVTILTSLFVVLVNKILLFVVRRFTLMEKHETVTAHNISVAFKLTMGRFINTAIIPIIVNLSFEKWFVDGGLIPDVFYLILAISFFDSIMYFVDPPYMIKILKRWSAKRQGGNCTMT